VRQQRSVVRGQGLAGPVAVPTKCHYCKKPATALYAGFLMCAECKDSVMQLDNWYAEREIDRRAAVGSAFRRLCQAVRKRLWVVNLVFVAGAVLYLGAVLGANFLDWIRLGGAQ